MNTASYGMKYLLGRFRSVVLAMSPPKLWPTPSLLAFGGEGEAGETTLMLWEHCSAVAKTLVCQHHLSSYKQHYEGYYGER